MKNTHNPVHFAADGVSEAALIALQKMAGSILRRIPCALLNKDAIAVTESGAAIAPLLSDFPFDEVERFKSPPELIGFIWLEAALEASERTRALGEKCCTLQDLHQSAKDVQLSSAAGSLANNVACYVSILIQRYAASFKEGMSTLALRRSSVAGAMRDDERQA